MAGGGGQHTHGHDNIVLTTQYYGVKATKYFSKGSEAGAHQLKRDLEKLRFPSPKVQNIKFVSHGCMMAIWIDPNDHIRQCLDIAVNRPSLYQPGDLTRLSIRSFALNRIPGGAFQAPYYDIPYVQFGTSSAASLSNSSTVQSQPPMRPRHAKAGPSTLPPKLQSQAHTQQSRTGSLQASPQNQQGTSSTSNHTLQGKPISTVKRSAEVHDLNGTSSKRAKIDPPKNDIGAGSSVMTRSMRKIAETNATNANSSASDQGQYGSLSQADIPQQTISSLASTSLSSHTLSSLPQQVTPRNHPIPQPTPMSSSQGNPLNLRPNRPSKWDIPNPVQLSGLGAQPGEGRPDPQRKVTDADRWANIEKYYINATQRTLVQEGYNTEPQPTNGAFAVNQPPQRSSTSHLNSTSPTIQEDQIKELARQLTLCRRELKEKLDQEVELYRQIQETGLADQPNYPKCLVTGLKDIQQALKERDKDLEDAQKTAAAAEKALENEREKLKKSEEELQEGRKIQVENERQFKSEQDKRIKLERELSSEKNKRMDVEEELQKEGKLRIKAEDALMNNDVASQAMKVELDRSLALIESMRKEGESLREDLETERANQMALQTKRKNDELKQRDEESKRRTALEEELERERSLRLCAEAMLKDVERECRAPFVVPALLEAFTTISNLTTQVMEADALPTCK